MVRLSDFINLPLTSQDVAKALIKAVNSEGVGIDNLRHRARMVTLDCKIRGYIGEIALRKWFNQYDVTFESADFFDDDTNMDIDLLYMGQRPYNFEVKTSLVPDSYQNLSGVIQRADIKIIKRTNDIESVSGDVHIQIYFDFLRKIRDNELKALPQDLKELPQIYSAMKLSEYIGNTYFVAWIDKPTLVQFINSQTRKTWTFPYAKRDFWRCPIGYIAKKPLEIIPYIQTL